ncbi:MAG: AMP-binding protein [Xanthomonas sp.]
MSRDRAAIEEIVRLSPQANGLLFHALKDGNDAYHVGVTLEIHSSADRAAIEQAWQRIQTAQPALRTVFVWKHLREPHQVIHRRPRVALQYHELEDNEQADTMAAAFVAHSRRQPFRLETEVVRIACFRVPHAGRITLAFCFHHVLMDGWSSALLVACWIAALRGETIPALDARAYARQLDSAMRAPALRDSEAFWRERFRRLGEGIGTRLLDEPMFAVEPGRDGRLCRTVRHWDASRKQRIEALCAQAGVTPACFVYLCWGLVLAKCTLQQVAVMGCTFSGRGALGARDAELSALGLFTNTVPLAIPLDGAETAVQALRQVFTLLQGLRVHENTPPLMVREAAACSGDLYDTIVVLDNYPIDPALQRQDAAHRLQRLHSEESTHFGLTLSVSGSAQWEVALSTGDRYAGPSQVPDQVLHAFDAIASDVLDDPERALGQLRLSLGEGSAASSLAHGRAVQVEDIDTQLAALRQRLLDDPDGSYLHADAVPIANRALLADIVSTQAVLALAGFVPGDRVAIHVPKSRAAIAALLAVVFSGGSYVYLNPLESAQRRRALLDSAGCTLMLGEELAHSEAAPPVALRSLPIPLQAAPGMTQLPVPHLRAGRLPDGEFALVFTSGTTGQPKGIPVRNASVANQLAWFVEATALSPADRVLALTELNFDPSIQDVFATLLAGARLILPERAVLQERRAFARAVQTHGITLINFIPGAIAELLDDPHALPTIRLWILGGEALPVALRDRLRAAGQTVRNHYGPSETTVDCLSAEQQGGAITLGWPIDNVSVFAADVFGQPLPQQVRGELWVGGVAVAHGYWQRPEESARAFVSREDGRWYRTGDAVLATAHAGFLFHGRVDEQLKVNGVRIEPREFEAAAERVPGVRAAALLGPPDAGAGGWVLCVDSDEQTATIAPAIVRELHMRTARNSLHPQILALNGFARTATGKIDRVGLRTRVQAALGSLVERRRARPTDPLQQQVMAIWEEVIGRAPAHVDVNFFDAGGDSLRIVRLQSRLQDAFGDDIGVADLFEHPTVAAFAAWRQARSTSPHATGNPSLSSVTPTLARSGKDRLADRRSKIQRGQT